MIMNLRRFSFGTLAVLVLAACGGDPTAALESASSVKVAPGGSTTLSVDLNRSNAPEGAFSFAIAGLPSGVTATFDPTSAEADVERISLTFSASRDATRGVSLLTLTATGPGTEPLVATAPIALEVRGITVRGKVLAAGMDEPIPRAHVRVGESHAMTDARGEFTFDDVSLPYGLAVAIGDAMIDTYSGLTTESPVVRSLFGSPQVATYSSAIDVVLAAPVPQDQSVIVCASGIDGAASGCTTVGAGATAIWLPVNWAGANPRRQVKLTAHAFSHDEDGVTAIFGFAESAAITVEYGASRPTLELALGPAPATSTSTLSYTLPDWAEDGGQLTVAPLSDGRFIVLGDPTLSGPAILFPGAPQYASASGERSLGIAWRPSTSTSTAPLTFPSVPELITIPDDLSGEFVLSAHAPGELSVVALFLSDCIVFVHTATDRFRLPDLSDFTGPEPREYRATALLARGSNFGSMDDAVTGDGLLNALIGLFDNRLPNVASEGSLTVSTLPR